MKHTSIGFGVKHPGRNTEIPGSIRLLLTLLFTTMLAFAPACSDKLPEITSNAIYVANEEAGTISVINAETREIIETIDLKDKNVFGNDVMFMPHNVQVAPNGESVWVTGVPMEHGEEEQVIVIDPIKNKIKERIKVGVDPHLAHVVLDNESRYAYVTANEVSEVIKIDAKKCKEVSRFNLGAGRKPHGLRYYNGKLYVANMDGNSLSVIDVASSQITEVALGGVAVQTAISPDGQNVYVTLYDTKEVVRVNISTLTVTRLALPSSAQGPIQLYPTPNNTSIYVCDQGGLMNRPTNNKVYVIDLASFTISDSITAGNKVHGVVVDNKDQFAYVTNTDDNTVSVLEISTGTVIATISVGTEPNGISCWHKHGSDYAGQP